VAMKYFLMQKKNFDIVESLENNPYFLYSSQLLVSAKPILVRTLLGSCVSVCLWDPIRKVGGINHFMLPLWNGEGLPTPKYGNVAIEKLLERMLAAGCKQTNLLAKIFGGAESFASRDNNFRIGLRNIAIAEKLLAEYKIPIVATSVGGYLGRNIQFNSATGEILLKYIKRELIKAQ
jgi:chemotaxis protein CheD